MDRRNALLAIASFFASFFSLFLLRSKKTVVTGVAHHTDRSLLPVWHPDFQTTYIEPYECANEDIPVETVQCPIPKENRVFNYTGTQCVFSTIETIGRWAEHEKLSGEEPITSLRDCQTYSNPSHAGGVLNRLSVKYTQKYNTDQESIKLIKKCMLEGRACLFSIPGHAMTLVHYDEDADRVCFIDNSDRTLKIQEADMAWFKRRWTGWVLAIYREPDLIPRKNPPARRLPILDANGKSYPNGYFITPGKEAIPHLEIDR